MRGSSSVPPYFSLKLAKASRVVKLQLAFRTDHATGQGKNVMVQVGTSPQYNANDPICTEIPQLSGTGLVDYDCNQFHTGQYVIISTDRNVLTICEAKVFAAEAGKSKAVYIPRRKFVDMHAISFPLHIVSYISYSVDYLISRVLL